VSKKQNNGFTDIKFYNKRSIVFFKNIMINKVVRMRVTTLINVLANDYCVISENSPVCYL
jgi:hypothetical protein